MPSPISSRVRACVIAGIVTGATMSGLATAHATPAVPSIPTVSVAGACQSYWPTPYQVCGAIRDLYNKDLSFSDLALTSEGKRITVAGFTKSSSFLK